MQGLTLSLALFFLLILVPGYLGVNASGRMEEARNRFYPVLYHGIMNFGIVFIISLSVVKNKTETLYQLLLGNYTSLSGYHLFIWIAVFCGVAIILGTMQLLVDMRSNMAIKSSIDWRRFWVKDIDIETSPRDDIFKEIFLCYRLIGKRPIITVTLSEKKTVSGEVLKMSWGYNSGLLLSEMDDPRNIIWIPMQSIISVRFHNPGIISQRNQLDNQSKKVLNLIHPGYGDEVQRKIGRS